MLRGSPCRLLMPLTALQSHDAACLKGGPCLIGIDEAGRGALAGPVVAGACVLRADFFQSLEAVERSAGIHDSKQLSAGAREAQYAALEALQAAALLDFAVAEASVAEIAELNILGATRLAMRRAVEQLAQRATGWTLPPRASEGPLFDNGSGVRLLVDGRPLQPWPYAHEGMVKGDSRSLAIAMASIAAKVTRDRALLRLASKYPRYAFEGHKGYATKAHREAILTHGPCPEHRGLFLRKVLAAGR